MNMRVQNLWNIKQKQGKGELFNTLRSSQQEIIRNDKIGVNTLYIIS